MVRLRFLIMIAAIPALFHLLSLFAFAKQAPAQMVTVNGVVTDAYGKPQFRVGGAALMRDANGNLITNYTDRGVDSNGRKVYYEWQSGNGGKFVIELSPGTYTVWANASSSNAVKLIVPKGKSSVSVKVFAGWTADYVKVNGTVVTTDGEPISMPVRVLGMEGSVWRSDEVGKFTIYLKAGKYKVWAVGAKSKAIDLIVPEANPKNRTTVEVKVLAKKHSILLKFLTPDDMPAINTAMALSERTGRGSWGSGPVNSDDKGFINWHLDDAPIWLFFAGKEGYANLDITNDEMLFSDEPITVQLSTGPFISGVILDESSKMPLGGVKIRPRRINTENDPWNRWNSQFGIKSYPDSVGDVMVATSNYGDGTFKLGPLPPGEFKLVIAWPGLVESEIKDVDINVSDGKDIENLKIAIPLDMPVYSLKGRVFKEDGKTPLASTEITVDVFKCPPPGHHSMDYHVWKVVGRKLITDAEGNFMLYPIRADNYILEAKSGGLTDTQKTSIPPGQPMLEFKLHAPSNRQ